MIRDKFHELLRELLAIAVRCYGDRLVTLAVFGSVGRERQRADSDVDIMIIADNLPDGRLRRMQEFEEIEDALEATLARLKDQGISTWISPIIKTPREVKRGSLIFLDMIDDATILYDRGGFFQSFLDDFKKRLTALGARRVIRGNSWHWVLKEKYREGEVFEL